MGSGADHPCGIPLWRSAEHWVCRLRGRANNGSSSFRWVFRRCGAAHGTEFVVRNDGVKPGKPRPTFAHTSWLWSRWAPTFLGVGWLIALAEDDPEGTARIAVFRQTLADLGWSEGGNLRIDYRWGSADADVRRKHAAELVAVAPDVIVGVGSAATAP